MLSLQWMTTYLCAATLVAAGAMVFAAWSRKGQQTAPAVAPGPALLAGALWPLVLAGVAQWLLVHALGTGLRRESRRTESIRSNVA